MALVAAQAASGQAKKPTLMVFPGETWCNANGYTTEMENQGRSYKLPDYERAVSESMDLVNVITKIGELDSRSRISARKCAVCVTRKRRTS